MTFIIQAIFYTLIVLFVVFCVAVFTDYDNIATIALFTSVFIMAVCIVFGMLMFLIGVIM